MNHDIFMYIVIIIVLYYYFGSSHMNIGAVFGICVGICVVIFLNKRRESELQNEQHFSDIKKNIIRPPVTNTEIVKYPDFINFLFSIQEFYSYAPPNYEDLVHSINDFLILYNESSLFPQTAADNYTIAQKKKSSALNSLHTFVFSLPPVVRQYFMDKLNRAIEKLDFILSGYLYKIFDINRVYVASNVLSTDSKLLDFLDQSKPLPSNYYSESNNNVTADNVTLNLY